MRKFWRHKTMTEQHLRWKAMAITPKEMDCNLEPSTMVPIRAVIVETTMTVIPRCSKWVGLIVVPAMKKIMKVMPAIGKKEKAA